MGRYTAEVETRVGDEGKAAVMIPAGGGTATSQGLSGEVKVRASRT